MDLTIKQEQLENFKSSVTLAYNTANNRRLIITHHISDGEIYTSLEVSYGSGITNVVYTLKEAIQLYNQ